jgi:hypothetical protein
VLNDTMQKPMFSDDEVPRPLLSEEELRDACLHAAATIVVATMFGCEFEDCRLSHAVDLNFESGAARVDHLIDYGPRVLKREQITGGRGVAHPRRRRRGFAEEGLSATRADRHARDVGVSSVATNTTGGIFALSLLSSTPWLQLNPRSLLNANRGLRRRLGHVYDPARKIASRLTPKRRLRGDTAKMKADC